MLHRATCRTISGVPSRGVRWTGPYIKLCGERDELESAVVVEFGGAAEGCGLCRSGLRSAPITSAAGGAVASPGRLASDAAPPVVRAGSWDRGWPARFVRPSGDSARLPLAPRLASWNRAGDPDQLRLGQFLAVTADLVAPRIERLPDPLALRLDVGLAPAVALLDAHDLDNYLYPLVVRLARLTGREFATVWAGKAHGPDSFITVETAVPDQRPGSFAVAGLLEVDASAQTPAFKRQVHDQVIDVEELPDGPVSLHLAFEVGRSRNWVNLWKPTIDALDPILGRSRANRDWHPRDGRIVELALHRHRRRDAAAHVIVAVGATAVS